MNFYSQQVLKYFKNPVNVGKIDQADGVGQVGNIRCGDMMKMYVKIEKEKIGDIKFETYGCAAAIATSSIVTEMVKGMTIAKALELTKDDVAKKLGGLPPIKMHCSFLALDALSEAIYDYFKKNKLEIPEKVAKNHKRFEKEERLGGA